LSPFSRQRTQTGKGEGKGDPEEIVTMITNHSQGWRDRSCHCAPPIGEIEPTARLPALSQPMVDHAETEGDIAVLPLPGFAS
jgi:hypothetical protein